MRVCAALGVVGAWLALQLADVILSLMLWSEPSFPDVLVYTSPMLLVVAWLLYLALARGTVTVEPDRLVIRHPRVLRRDLVVPREQVARIIVDDGAATGRARFATGDPAEPLLWTDPVVTRQYVDRPLIGDALLPNVALVLEHPLVMDAARDGITSVPVCDIGPPPRESARALLLTLSDLDAVRTALATWPLDRTDPAAVIPPQVAEGAAQVPRDAAGLVVLAMMGSLLLVLELHWLLPVLFIVAFAYVSDMVKRRAKAAEAARAEVRSRGLGPRDEATALAAIDANLGVRNRPFP
jgi:hypothetical protein